MGRMSTIVAIVGGVLLLTGGRQPGAPETVSAGGLLNIPSNAPGRHWHAPPGLNGHVQALVSFGEALYVAGGFTHAGDVLVNNVAKWDGSRWHSLAGGVAGTVYALAVDAEGNLYAGGTFAQAGGNAAKYVAKWDGERWSPLAGGVDHPVHSAAVDRKGTLYVGGGITRAGDVQAFYIAQWDGERWDRLGGGDDPDEYIVAPGGMFWYQTGGGTNHHVMALAPDDKGGIFVGGGFTEAYGITAYQVAHWDGKVWSPLGSAMNDSTFGRPVKALAYHDGVLYAGGLFSSAGDASGTAFIAAWNGERWSALGRGVNGAVLALAHDGEVLYAGGYFSRAGNVQVNHLAQWDGREWTAVHGGIDSRLINALHVDERGTLHVGGEISGAGGMAAGNLVCFGFATAISTGVEREHPAIFALHAPFPSPFATSTTVSFSVVRSAHVSVKVFDVLGREIALLVEGTRAPGVHLVTFDGTALPNGTYVVGMEVGARATSRTVILAR